MIYSRVQITDRGTLKPIFDLTIRNTGDAPGAGSQDSLLGNYEITQRIQDQCVITRTQTCTIKSFPRKDYDAADLMFLALYGLLGEERCTKLLKKMKSNISNTKSKKHVKQDPGKVKMAFGRGLRCAVPPKKEKKS